MISVSFHSTKSASFVRIPSAMAESSKVEEKKDDAAVVNPGEGEKEKKKLPQLGALEDDDEFEVGRASVPLSQWPPSLAHAHIHHPRSLGDSATPGDPTVHLCPDGSADV